MAVDDVTGSLTDTISTGKPASFAEFGEDGGRNSVYRIITRDMLGRKEEGGRGTGWDGMGPKREGRPLE